MYVAMTRARDHLHVVYPLTVYGSRWGADYSMDQLSRFIDREVRERMQRIAVTPETPDGAPADEPPARPALDVRALLRGRFAK